MLALLALVAFAANSVLCRLALRDAAIDAATFSTVRLTSGAAMLLLVSALASRGAPRVKGSWASAALLFLYAIPFSFAYIGLSTGTGALILFACVQMTMLLAALWLGERLAMLQWIGVAVAGGGLVYLVLPGLAAPPIVSAALMAVAGIAWGFYSLRGRGTTDPLAGTTGNFVRAVPMAAVVSIVWLSSAHAEPRGVWLAVASGAIASGLGYVIWYAALRRITATRAAIVQLAVPIIAALGGVVLLGEVLSVRLVVSAVLVLAGIALTFTGRRR